MAVTEERMTELVLAAELSPEIVPHYDYRV